MSFRNQQPGKYDSQENGGQGWNVTSIFFNFNGVLVVLPGADGRLHRSITLVVAAGVFWHRSGCRTAICVRSIPTLTLCSDVVIPSLATTSLFAQVVC